MVFSGAGGGLILVPCFIYILKIEPVRARATTLMCILPLTIVTSFIYGINNYLNWKIGILCAIGGIIGGVIGSYLLRKVPEYILRLIFMFFLLYFSVNMIIR